MSGPDSGGTALILIDVLNAYEHDDADLLASSMETALDPTVALLERARASEAEVIYVNDNYGDWNSSAEELGRRAMEGRRPDLVEALLPRPSDSFVIKARHSIFYGTPLAYLLSQSSIDRLVLAGQATEQCILYSALDAYVRHFEVVVPTDAVAHIDEQLAKAALEMIERNMRGELTTAAECRLGPA
jgi:nicotinamidase-related amidase